MTQTLIMGILAVVILLLVAFIGYYAFRLVRAGRAAESTAQRLQTFVQRQSKLQHDVLGAQGSAGETTSATPATEPVAPISPGAVRVFDRSLGLASLSSDPLFVRKTKEGEISVQIGDKPSMPLNYVLDPRTRRVLNEVVGVASGEFGLVWAVLAQDGEDGKLTVTRLV